MAKYVAYIAFTLLAISFSIMFDPWLNDYSWPIFVFAILFGAISIFEHDEEDKRKR
jgi:hypothetical protein